MTKEEYFKRPTVRKVRRQIKATCRKSKRLMGIDAPNIRMSLTPKDSNGASILKSRRYKNRIMGTAYGVKHTKV